MGQELPSGQGQRQHKPDLLVQTLWDNWRLWEEQRSIFCVSSAETGTSSHQEPE